MIIKVAHPRVIGGAMRSPGDIIDVPDDVGAQAIRDGLAQRVPEPDGDDPAPVGEPTEAKADRAGVPRQRRR